MISPRFLLFIVGETRTTPTPLEAFLALHFGIFIFAIAVSLLLNVCRRSILPDIRADINADTFCGRSSSEKFATTLASSAGASDVSRATNVSTVLEYLGHWFVVHFILDEHRHDRAMGPLDSALFYLTR